MTTDQDVTSMKKIFLSWMIKSLFHSPPLAMEKRNREDEEEAPGREVDVMEVAHQVGGGVRARFSINFIMAAEINEPLEPVDDEYYIDRSNFEMAHQLRDPKVLNELFQMRIAQKPKVLKMMYNEADPAGPMKIWFDDPTQVLEAIAHDELKKLLHDTLTVYGTDCTRLMLICLFSWKAYFFCFEDNSPAATDSQVFDALTKFNAVGAEPAAMAAGV